jgi:predicted nucleic acid-binding protein
MVSVLLDTNVVLDFAEERKGFYEAAKAVFKTVQQREMTACVSASAVTDIFYFLGKYYKDTDVAMALLKKLLRHLEIIAVNRHTIETAIESGMTDFEDAVQAAAAQDFGIDIVVTRDKTGFQNSGMQVYSPEEFLETLM